MQTCMTIQIICTKVQQTSQNLLRLTSFSKESNYYTFRNRLRKYVTISNKEIRLQDQTGEMYLFWSCCSLDYVICDIRFFINNRVAFQINKIHILEAYNTLWDSHLMVLYMFFNLVEKIVALSRVKHLMCIFLRNYWRDFNIFLNSFGSNWSINR